MKILFVDNSSSFNNNTINNSPMGGTQAAICLIAREFAKLKIQTFVMNKIIDKIKYNEYLTYVPYKNNIATINRIKPDIIIVQSSAKLGTLIRNYFNIKTLIWIHHDTNVNFIQNEYSDSNNLDNLDGFIFVSRWQMNKYISTYNVPLDKCLVIQNGISNKIKLKDEYYNKSKTLIYISSPYRGLHLLKPLFNLVKEQIPDIKLKIFSSFSRDDNSININNNNKLNLEDLNNFTNQYDKYYKNIYKSLIETEGIEYYGSVSQDVLFENIANSMALFYPNIFPETCCTSILEAMALRCNIISSNLGALPETCNGFGSLQQLNIKTNNNVNDYIVNPIKFDMISKKYIECFVEETIKYINTYYSKKNQIILDKQQEYIKTECLWEHKTQILLKFINNINKNN